MKLKALLRSIIKLRSQVKVLPPAEETDRWKQRIITYQNRSLRAKNSAGIPSGVGKPKHY